MRSSFGAPKNLPRGEGADGVGGRGNAERNGDRGTNQDGVKSCVFSSSVSTSAATFPMGEGLERHYLNDTTIATALEWLRKSFNLFGHRSTQRQGNKRSAAADLIASNAPLRNGSHKARPVSCQH